MVGTTAATTTDAAEDVLEGAYTACGAYTKESSATFYFATMLMQPRER